MSEAMKPARAEKWLTILFRLNAILLSSAALAIFLPNGWMQTIHQWLGLGQLPEAAITGYLARSCSLLYAMHGVVLLMVSLDMRQNWNLVGCLAILHMVLGVVMLGIDLNVGMPWYWTATEGPGILVFGGFLFWLWKRASSDR